MNRNKRGRRAAVKAARQSEFYAHKVGAAVFVGSRLIAIGWNQHKTHPECDCFTQHAEFTALRKAKKQLASLEKATLYVARLTRTSRVSYSRPCSSCQNQLVSAGISKVYYTDYNGKLSQLTFNEEHKLCA